MAQAVDLRKRYPVQDTLFSFFFWVVKILPFWFFRAFSGGIFYVLLVMSRRLHKNALESLGIAFGATLSLERKRQIARRSFLILLEGFAAHVYGMMHPQFTLDNARIEGREHLDVALARGKGVVIAVGHYGPFTWMMQYLGYLGYPIHVVMRAPRSAFFRERFRQQSPRHQLSLIYSVPVRECVVESFRVLKAGGIVVMPIDQNYGGHGRLFVDFFGRKAATAPGAAGYALKTGAALLMAYSYKAADGKEHLVVDPEIVLEGVKDDRDGMIRITQQLTARLEELIRQRVERWSWMHRRWKAVPRENEV